MKLELLVSQPRKPPVRKVHNHRELPFQIICLETGAQSESTSHLNAFVDPLSTDIARAIHLKRPINESFLETCFDKWVHTSRDEMQASDPKLALFVLVPPPLSGKKRDFLMATWGNAGILESKDNTWRQAKPVASFDKEGVQSTYFRLPHPNRAAFFAIYPCEGKTLQKTCTHLARVAPVPNAKTLDASALDNFLADEGAAESSWLYLQCEHLSNWSPSRLMMRSFALATRALRKVLALPLSRKKIVMISSGIIFSALFTAALTTCTKRATPSTKPQTDEPANSRATEDLDSPNTSASSKGGFHPYSGWIAWLYNSPRRPENWQKSPLSTGLSLSDGERSENATAFPSYLTKGSRARISLDESRPAAPVDTHALRDLEVQIQTDLANLQRHQLLLAKLAERQAPTAVGKGSPYPRWLKEEQKRSAKHLLLARNSLEKIARRYSEWTHLASTHQSADASKTASTPVGGTTASVNLLVQSVKRRSLLERAGWASPVLFGSNTAFAISPSPASSALSLKFKDPQVWGISTPFQSDWMPTFALEPPKKFNKLELP